MVSDQVNKIRQHCFVNESGDMCHHECLDGYLLADGEILNITWEDGLQESVQIRLRVMTSRDVTEFGGVWHGFKHKEISNVSVVNRPNGERVFLRFADDVKVERLNAPLGEQINE